jgi:hypothetical protein
MSERLQNVDLSKIERRIHEIKSRKNIKNQDLAFAYGVIDSVCHYLNTTEIMMSHVVFEPIHPLWDELYHIAPYRDLNFYIEAMKNNNFLKNVALYLERNLQEDYK